MSPQFSDSELLDFIRGSIRSVWALELLLLLRRQADRAWSTDDLAMELRANTPLVADVLKTFETAGLVRSPEPGSYTYAPASPALERYCRQLDDAYRERPVSVINAIVSAPNDKLQSFADAFRLKGGKR